MAKLISLAFYLVILVIIITVHEFAHAWTAHQLGDLTAKREGRLTLNPLAHIDPFYTLILPITLILFGSPIVFGAAKPVPFNPYAVRYGKWGAALIAFAGPASNFLMAGLVAIYIRFVPLQAGLGSDFLVTFVTVNLAFFVFNMLPIPPLDGSRLLYAIAPPPLADAMERFERFGLMGILLIVLVLYAFVSPFILSIVTFLATALLGYNPF